MRVDPCLSWAMKWLEPPYHHSHRWGVHAIAHSCARSRIRSIIKNRKSDCRVAWSLIFRVYLNSADVIGRWNPNREWDWTMESRHSIVISASKLYPNQKSQSCEMNEYGTKVIAPIWTIIFLGFVKIHYQWKVGPFLSQIAKYFSKK